MTATITPSRARAEQEQKGKGNRNRTEEEQKQKAPAAPNGNGHRKPRPDVTNARFAVHRWQIEELISMLGPYADKFDLDEWLMTGCVECAKREN